MNYTANHNLPIWEKTDRIRMEDFNAMTTQLDAAITAEQTAREQAVTATNARMDRLGNCTIYHFTYTGSAPHNAPAMYTHTFPGQPLVLFVSAASGGVSIYAPYGVTFADAGTGGSTYRPVKLTWDGNTVSWVASKSTDNLLNVQDQQYRIVALLAADA